MLFLSYFCFVGDCVEPKQQINELKKAKRNENTKLKQKTRDFIFHFQ